MSEVYEDAKRNEIDGLQEVPAPPIPDPEPPIPDPLPEPAPDPAPEPPSEQAPATA
jgi:hypothetical protein